MSRARLWLRLVITVFAIVGASACAQPPDKEMQQAQGAIDAARAAGADQYARDEFDAAQTALKEAHEAVELRDYRLALNHALDSRERAQTSAKEAADRKGAARVNADRALTTTTATLTNARTKLKAAETARTPSKNLAASHLALADAEQRVQEARAAFDRGEYEAVVSMLSTATQKLESAAHEPEPPPARRRR